MGEIKIKWLTEWQNRESNSVRHCVCLQGYEMSTRLWDATHLQGVKSLPGAPGYSTQAFLVHFSTCITSVPDDHREPLFCLCEKEKKGSIHLCAFLSFPQGFFKVVSEKKKKSCLHCLLFPLCGIKLHFEGVGWWLGGGGGESCHASHTGRSRGNKQGQIHQKEGVAQRDGERWVLIKVEQLNSF